MSKRKTTGLEWLLLSLASFNGSGYADKSTPESYIASYRAYKTWKKDKYAIEQLNKYEGIAKYDAERLCMAKDAGHTPTAKNLAKFNQYYQYGTGSLL